MHSPMEQFEIKRLISFHIGSLDASYTNSALWMTIAVIVAFLLFVVGVRQRALLPAWHCLYPRQTLAGNRVGRGASG